MGKDDRRIGNASGSHVGSDRRRISIQRTGDYVGKRVLGKNVCARLPTKRESCHQKQ
jgi:hypothetical protein